MQIEYDLSDPRLLAVLDVKGDGRVTSACIRFRDSADSDDSLTASAVKSVPWTSLLKEAQNRATLPEGLQARVDGYMADVMQRAAYSTSSTLRVRPDNRRKDEALEWAKLVVDVRDYAESQGLSAPEVVAAAFSTDRIIQSTVTSSQWVRDAALLTAGLDLERAPRTKR